MSATYGFSRTTITVTPVEGDVIEYEKATVLVRGARGRIRNQNGALLRERPAVLASERLGPNHWQTTFADGERWEVVVDNKGCAPCGG